MQFVTFNRTTDPDVTRDVLLQISAAVSTQVARDFAPLWSAKGLDVSATLSVAENDAGVPSDAVPIFVVDSLDEPGDLGYHDDEDGLPHVYIGWGAIKQNGGTLTSGSNSLSCTFSHEVLETLGDPDADEWVLKAAPGEKLAEEACDPCEADSYSVAAPAVGSLPAADVAVSNFVTPEFFDLSRPAGTKFDFLGRISGAQVADRGGYEINMDPRGNVTNDFAARAEDGGVPEWKRAEKAKKKKIPRTRHARRAKKAVAA